MSSRLPRRIVAVLAVSAACTGGLAVAGGSVASAATGTVTPNPVLDTGSHVLTLSGLSGIYLTTPDVQLVGPAPGNAATYSGKNVNYDSANSKVSATFTFPSGGAAPGSYTYEVCPASLGCSVVEDSGSVTLDAPPTVTAVTTGTTDGGNPPVATAGQGATALPATITGTGFQSDAQVTVAGGTGAAVTFTAGTVAADGTSISGVLTVPADASPGLRDVTVTNPTDGGAVTDSGALRVTAAPAVTKLSRSAAAAGAHLTETFTGTGFEIGADAAHSTAVTAPDLTITVQPASSTATKLVADVAVAADAQRGPRTLTLTSPDGGTGSCSKCFQVAVAPSAPQSLSASLSPTVSTTASLTWQAPADSGGAGVASYQVSAQPAVAGLPKSVTGTSATVSGLKPGTTYTFSVAAVNVAGTGPAATAQLKVPTSGGGGGGGGGSPVTVVAGRTASGAVAVLGTTSGKWQTLGGLTAVGDPTIAGSSAGSSSGSNGGEEVVVVAESAKDHDAWLRSLTGGTQRWVKLSGTRCDQPGAAVSGRRLYVACRSRKGHLLLGSVKLSNGTVSGTLRFTDEGGALTSGPGLAPVGTQGVIASFTQRAYDRRGDNTYATLSFDRPKEFAKSHLACDGRPGLANAGDVVIISCASGRKLIAEYGATVAHKGSVTAGPAPGTGATLSAAGKQPTVWYVHDRLVSSWRVTTGAITPYPGASIVGGVTAVRLR